MRRAISSVQLTTEVHQGWEPCSRCPRTVWRVSSIASLAEKTAGIRGVESSRTHPATCMELRKMAAHPVMDSEPLSSSHLSQRQRIGTSKMVNRTSQLRVVVFLIVVLLGSVASVSAQIAPTFFGMQMGKGSVTGQPWPVDKICTNPFQGCDGFGGVRLWDSGTAWALINYAPGQYDWSILDAWINDAKKHQVDLVYCFGRVPLWASSKPNDTKCANGGGPGQCDPPNDLNKDGTGTNQHFKDFV